MSVGDRLAYWKGRWDRREIEWQENDTHFALTNHSHKLLTKPKCRIFVPLCGKSVDLVWLYRQGHTVVGVEAMEQGINEFFSEHNLPHITEQMSWAKVFKTEDDRLKVYCCDLFKIDAESLGKFDAVWDRGSLVAVYEEDRERYAALIKNLLAPEFRYLLEIFRYKPKENFNRTPRLVPIELVKDLFGDVCELQVLETVRLPEEKTGHLNVGSVDVVEVLLTPRV